MNGFWTLKRYYLGMWTLRVVPTLLHPTTLKRSFRSLNSESRAKSRHHPSSKDATSHHNLHKPKVRSTTESLNPKPATDSRTRHVL